MARIKDSEIGCQGEMMADTLNGRFLVQQKRDEERAYQKTSAKEKVDYGGDQQGGSRWWAIPAT